MRVEFLPDKRFMEEALALAEEALNAGEIPVGAVIVKDGSIIGKGRNRREEKQSALSHAEIEAVADACQSTGSWRLDGAEIYITLEPCPMCAGAILTSRIRQIIYAADDEKAGACGTALDVLATPAFRRPKVYRGFMEAESKVLLRAFFDKIRN